jgi:hypothetical protein
VSEPRRTTTEFDHGTLVIRGDTATLFAGLPVIDPRLAWLAGLVMSPDQPRRAASPARLRLWPITLGLVRTLMG